MKAMHQRQEGEQMIHSKNNVAEFCLFLNCPQVAMILNIFAVKNYSPLKQMMCELYWNNVSFSGLNTYQWRAVFFYVLPLDCKFSVHKHSG